MATLKIEAHPAFLCVFLGKSARHVLTRRMRQVYHSSMPESQGGTTNSDARRDTCHWATARSVELPPWRLCVVKVRGFCCCCKNNTSEREPGDNATRVPEVLVIYVAGTVLPKETTASLDYGACPVGLARNR